jgi:phosphatidylserine/phosphatidylglycerophosphate/cardiolipin synthase-like enzyme
VNKSRWIVVRRVKEECGMFAINVFNNGDHTCVAWRPADADPATWAPLAGCRGFAVERKLTRNGVTSQSWLRNRVGFAEGAAAPGNDEAWRWPLQRYLWWDYSVRPGDTVSYRVAPMIGRAAALVAPDEATAADWTAPQLVGSEFGDDISAWFNRGIIASQWVERALAAQGAADRKTLMAAISEKGNPLREQLGGLLKEAVLSLLRDPPGDIYAALYELNDDEVTDALIALGPRCNLILGNGAFQPPETDENKEVRDKLKATAIKLHDRIVSSGHFAHNKFILFCDAAGKPAAVFTGSTNLTRTGLCTQANNGILIRDPAVAQDYFDAWHRLLDAGSAYPAKLIAGNSIARTRVVGGTRVSPWFAATGAAEDMIQARALIEAAEQGILFLFFNPGHLADDPMKETLLQNVIERKAKGDLYVRGVVNQEITGLTDAAEVPPVRLVRSGRETDHLPKSVLVPAGIKEKYGDWEAELKGASSVMVHSKVIVLDPFGARPVVMTGSHNLGFKASHANDDNLNIIEGNAKLAQAYAANIVAIFQEYRWRDYVASHQVGGWKGLQDDDAWQAGHLERECDEMLFWVPKPAG